MVSSSVFTLKLRKFDAAVEHRPDVGQRVRVVPERWRNRLGDDEVFGRLAEIRQLGRQAVVEEPGVKAGFELLAALRLEVGVARIARDGAGAGGPRDVVGRGDERVERVTRVGRAARGAVRGAETQRVDPLGHRIEELLLGDGPAAADLRQHERRGRRAERRVLVDAHADLEEALVGIADLHLREVAELALLGEAARTGRRRRRPDGVVGVRHEPDAGRPVHRVARGDHLKAEREVRLPLRAKLPLHVAEVVERVALAIPEGLAVAAAVRQAAVPRAVILGEEAALLVAKEVHAERELVVEPGRRQVRRREVRRHAVRPELARDAVDGVVVLVEAVPAIVGRRKRG